jgi:hypothetical protein
MDDFDGTTTFNGSSVWRDAVLVCVAARLALMRTACVERGMSRANPTTSRGAPHFDSQPTAM